MCPCSRRGGIPSLVGGHAAFHNRSRVRVRSCHGRSYMKKVRLRCHEVGHRRAWLRRLNRPLLRLIVSLDFWILEVEGSIREPSLYRERTNVIAPGTE